MSAPEWTDNLEAAHNATTRIEDGLDDEDLAVLESRGFSLEDYQSLFAEAFMQYRDDPNNELLPEERAAARLEFFSLLDDMGYSGEEFRWKEWREWMGYE